MPKVNIQKSRFAVRVQYAALPYRFNQVDGLEILLVTTRRTKRWIIPKGWATKGVKPPESAAREAYEEAGVRGKIGKKSVGVFTYKKLLDEEGITVPCEVKVFPLLVKRQSKIYPEIEQRLTRWLEPEKAVSLVKEMELKARSFDHQPHRRSQPLRLAAWPDKVNRRIPVLLAWSRHH